MAVVASDEIRRWVNRVGAADDVRQRLVEDVSRVLAETAEEVRDAGQVEFDHVRNTEADPILDRIRKLLDGSVGIEPATDQLETDVKEGLRRVKDELPPGFKDKRKGDESAGDYLVWVQSLRECVDRTDTLVFVTGDSVGDDWYRREGSEIRGPRVELFDEARTKAGVRLYLLRPASLLKHAGAALRIEVEADTVASVEGVDSASAQAAWTNDNFADLLARLRSEGPVQRLAILHAVENGGFISRDEVYGLGEYDTDRTLRGFTRPTNRIMRWMQFRGYLADGAAEPLSTIYDGGVTATQRSACQ